MPTYLYQYWYHNNILSIQNINILIKSCCSFEQQLVFTEYRCHLWNETNKIFFSPLCLHTSPRYDHVLPQHHIGHAGRRKEDELHGPRWETHHGALGKGGTHHQPWDQPLRGFCQGGGRWSHLYPAGRRLKWSVWDYILLVYDDGLIFGAVSMWVKLDLNLI